MSLINSVGYEEDYLREQAQALASQLNYALVKEADLCVFVSANGLCLKIPDLSPLCADFRRATWNKRKSEGKKQGLIRACKPTNTLKIIDATAGWGKDAAILASFGAQVLMLERHPIMACLLADALLRRDEDKDPLGLSLHAGDAYSFIGNLSKEDYPDVIYIDPMHPERTKSALVKKEMQVLQQMIGADHDALELIKLAITRVKQRVVVKWPQKSNSLLPADNCIAGKTVRFDIYRSQL